MRRYLLTLEIVPLETGHTYAILPAHLTLVSRFLTEQTPAQLSAVLRPLFTVYPPVQLDVAEAQTLGPKQVLVNPVLPSTYLRRLHTACCDTLDALAVSYEYPQFIRSNHVPHISVRRETPLQSGQQLRTSAAYLIEIIDHRRYVANRFQLAGHADVPAS